MNAKQFVDKKVKIVRNEEHREINKWGCTKASARQAVNSAVSTGAMQPKSKCAACGRDPGLTRNGRSRLQAHHRDGYDEDKSLDIVWLCPECHWAVHHGEPKVSAKPQLADKKNREKVIESLRSRLHRAIKKA